MWPRAACISRDVSHVFNFDLPQDAPDYVATVSAAPPAPAPRAMPSVSRARSTRYRSRTSKVISDIRFPFAPIAPEAARHRRGGRCTGAFTTGPSAWAAASHGGGSHAGPRGGGPRGGGPPRRRLAQPQGLPPRGRSHRGRGSLRQPAGNGRRARTVPPWHSGASLELSSPLWWPPPAAPGRPKPIQRPIIVGRFPYGGNRRQRRPRVCSATSRSCVSCASSIVISMRSFPVCRSTCMWMSCS